MKKHPHIRLISKQKIEQPPVPTRNGRVKEVNQEEWIKNRKAQFNQSVEYAGAAKSYRTVLHVTQWEIGTAYGVTAAAVGRWESGHYFNWNDDDFDQYIDVCNEIAAENKDRKRNNK